MTKLRYDPPSFTGRRVDLMGRSLDVTLDAEPAIVLRDYLSTAHTTSAKEMAAKAVVLITPEQLAGTVVWPKKDPSLLQPLMPHLACTSLSWRPLGAGAASDHDELHRTGLHPLRSSRAVY